MTQSSARDRFSSVSPRTGLLRGALAANAVFSIATAVAIGFQREALSTLFLEVHPLVVAGVALGLLPFGIGVAFQAWRPEPAILAVKSIVVGDVGWVAGTAVLLCVFPALSVSAVLLLGVTAGVVLAFAIAQSIGLKRMVSGSAPEKAGLPSQRVAPTSGV